MKVLLLELAFPVWPQFSSFGAFPSLGACKYVVESCYHFLMGAKAKSNFCNTNNEKNSRTYAIDIKVVCKSPAPLFETLK